MSIRTFARWVLGSMLVAEAPQPGRASDTRTRPFLEAAAPRSCSDRSWSSGTRAMNLYEYGARYGGLLGPPASTQP
jgi:hypothetical protein